MSEYTHNDDVADMIHEYDKRESDLNKQIEDLMNRLESARTELRRIETEYSRGL
jgi:prefoldin subunit 5